MTRSILHFTVAAALACMVAIAAAAPAVARTLPATSNDVVEIRRTDDGVAHIRATSWRGLGEGVGMAQQQDAPCTLGQAFVTFRGERSRFFGAKAQPDADSTFGRPANVESDLFFRVFLDDVAISAYRRAQPQDLDELVVGYAIGYNRALREFERQRAAARSSPCRGADWLHPIAPEDVYRRFRAATLAAGDAKFISDLYAASNGGGAAAVTLDDIARRAPVGERIGLGSNAMAFGHAATGAGPVLFGNPHWYWEGPDRFWQMHLTMPGRLDVAGVAFLGVPMVMIGFNRDVAWSHTVSRARRFGFFDLKFDAADARRYEVDGQMEALIRREVDIPVRAGDGTIVNVRSGIDFSRWGPLVEVAGHRLALRDINDHNPDTFRNFLEWDQARSLDDFVAIQRRDAAMPWVNTIAVGRADERVWYGEIGAVPDATDALRATCSTPFAEAFAQRDASTPVLDGSRSACAWTQEATARRPGFMPASRQPGLFRNDAVANMNDSHWLASAAQPLVGFDRVLGGEREALSLRARAGHAIVDDLLANAPLAPDELATRLRLRVLDARAESATLFRGDVLRDTCGAARDDANLVAACDVLDHWSGSGSENDRGAPLWDTFWAQLGDIPEAELYGRPFSADDPLHTPSGFSGAKPRVVAALRTAVLALRAAGVRLDAARGDLLNIGAGPQAVRLFGGCEEPGYFTMACASSALSGVDSQFFGNSYLQVVRFAPDRSGHPGKPLAATMLAHGEAERTAQASGSTHEGPATRRYAAREWTNFAFERDAVIRNSVSVTVCKASAQGSRCTSTDRPSDRASD